MKICYVLYSGQVGGAEQHYFDLASGMVKRGHQVWSLMPEGPMAARSRRAGVKVIVAFPKLDIDPGFISLATQFFRKNQIDVVHTLQLKTNVNGLIAAYLAGVPVRVGHLLGSLIDWEVPVWKTIPNVLANSMVMNLFATHVMALSPAVAQTLRRKEKITPGKIHIIAASIEVNSFKNAPNKNFLANILKLKRSDIVIGCVGRLTVEKGQRYFVAAAPRIKQLLPQAQLVVVGDGRERAELEQMTRDLGISSYCHLLGFQPDNYKRSILKELDIFVFPSIREGFGIAMVEAMAAGTPVVAAGLPEVRSVVSAKEALFFRPRDPRDLATKVAKLAANKKLQRNLSQAAFKKVNDNYDTARIVDQYEELYQHGRS